ncbi:MAG TPA: 3-dehydroquinate synthase [Coxiellaceae bacterium]|nr:3-dehydroquinate synthase [Coxiellaceae bacterium]
MLSPTLTIQNKDFSYPVFIASNCLRDHSLWSSLISQQQVFIVSDENVAPLYLEKFSNALTNKQITHTILACGEKSKNLTQFANIIDHLAENNYARDCLIVGLGGGVVTDLAGFVAACYMRGVDFIQIPTSLLAQVDAAIGGKTAVNHPQAKNLIGCFYQPKAVIIDTNTLTTLDERNFRAGLAEVIKMAVSFDENLFGYLEQQMAQLLERNQKVLQYIIQRCCELKANIVTQDEKEQGLRSLLNFGHTYGHALEKIDNYQRYLHGEAVAIGMVIAAELSVKDKLLSVSEQQRLVHLIASAGLPTQIPSTLNQTELNKSLLLDKKIKNGKLSMVLLKKIGQARSTIIKN